MARPVTKPKGASSRAVHAGEFVDPTTGSLVTPIYQTATFAFKSTRHVLDVMSGRRPGNVYTRWWNPTNQAVERKLAELEGAEEAMTFSSGMAAISSAVISMVSKGDHVLAITDLYGATYELFAELLPVFGVKTTFVPTDRITKSDHLFKPRTRLVYFESPTNPTLKVVDIRAVVRLARKHGATTIIDSTFASPFNQQPAKLGVDVVVHSATKYLSGHLDLIAGALATSKRLAAKIWETRKILGGSLDPHAAWLLLRGLKTLALRVQRHNQSAQRIAEFLEAQPKVRAVYYPGLKSNPMHHVARKQMRGFGGMLSFEPKGGAGKASKLVDRLRVATLAPSLGGPETLVCQPWTLTHWYMPPKARRRAGISNSLIRVSVGIEDVEDLIADFRQALRAI